jgi:hypothetical protein
MRCILPVGSHNDVGTLPACYLLGRQGTVPVGSPGGSASQHDSHRRIVRQQEDPEHPHVPALTRALRLRNAEVLPLRRRLLFGAPGIPSAWSPSGAHAPKPLAPSARHQAPGIRIAPHSGRPQYGGRATSPGQSAESYRSGRLPPAGTDAECRPRQAPSGRNGLGRCATGSSRRGKRRWQGRDQHYLVVTVSREHAKPLSEREKTTYSDLREPGHARPPFDAVLAVDGRRILARDRLPADRRGSDVGGSHRRHRIGEPAGQAVRWGSAGAGQLSPPSDHAIRPAQTMAAGRPRPVT